MLYGHVFGKISNEFRVISRVFVNFADLPEFCGSATARNIRSPDYHVRMCKNNWCEMRNTKQTDLYGAGGGLLT